MGFFVATDAELAAANAQILADLEAGVESFQVDDQKTVMADPLRRLQALQKLAVDVAIPSAASQPHRGLRFTKLIGPGGGG